MTEKNLTRAITIPGGRRHARSRAFVVAATALACWANVGDAQDAAPHSVELLTGQSYHQVLGAEDEVVLSFDADPNDSYILEVDQGGLDLVVAVEAPNGSTQAYNSPLLRDETELVVFDAPEDGRYRIHLYTDEHTGSKARLSAELTRGTGADPREREAQRLIARASAANHAGTMEGWNEALVAYEAVLGTIPSSSDRRLAARSLFSMATIEYWQMGRWRRAADLAGEAAGIYASSGHPRLAASANQLRAAALIEETTEIEKTKSGEIAPEALILFAQALALFHQARDAQLELQAPYDAALSANYLGLTYYYMGDWDRATPWYRKAAEEHRAVDEWTGELQSLGNLAVVDFERGRLLSAIETFERILDLLPPDKSQRYRADTLDNLAASQLALGRLEEALKNFSKALAIHQTIEDQKGKGRSLAGIGVSYFNIGEQELALEHLQAALTARRAVNDGRGQVSVLNFLGNIRRQRGEIDEAMEAHTKALRIATTPVDQARTEVYLSQDLIAASDAAAALDMLAQAQRIADHTGNPKLRADTSRVRGDALLLSGQYEESLAAFNAATEAYRALALRAEESQAMFGTARVLRAQDRLEPALREAGVVIEIVEDLRGELIDPELRGFFLATRQSYYDFLVDVNMDLHARATDGSDRYLREALAASERSRARALIDLVAESSVSRSQAGTDEQARQLYEQLAEARYRLNRAIEVQKPNEKDRESLLAPIQHELALIENRLNLLQIRRREEDPRLASHTDPEILSADQIQQSLDQDTVLLQYDLGERSGYVWKVTRGDIEAGHLPAREVIEEDARTLYGLLRAPANASRAREALSSKLDHLSNVLLGSLSKLGGRRLIIVADGVLQYLPFSLLSHPAADGYLLLAHEIVYVPSISTLATQRANHTVTRQPARTIAIFADPVFNPTDSRFSDTERIKHTVDPDLGSETSLSTLLAADLNRLPATRFEAQAISDLVPPDEVLLAVGFDASKATVLEAGLDNFRLVHFATHGLIDSRYPALSSLVLSQFDTRGQPLDGFLRLPDIYALPLNAELVTLSACSTALGREISGEGLTGLTQALMYSGSRSVLASLWQVPDRATAELMKRFYRNLLDLKQRPAEALRNAQLDLSNRPRWREPYFWSAFVLQGDWL